MVSQARALVQSEVALGFLDAAAALPAIETRVVWRDKAAGRAYSQAEYEALPEDERPARRIGRDAPSPAHLPA